MVSSCRARVPESVAPIRIEFGGLTWKEFEIEISLSMAVEMENEGAERVFEREKKKSERRERKLDF